MWYIYAQHTCESRISIFNFVCHMIELRAVFGLIDVFYQSQQFFNCFILLLTVPESLPTLIFMVVQFLPSTSISELSEHILWRALQLFQSLPEVQGYCPCKALAPAGEKTHFSWLIHSTSERTFRHDASHERSKQ